MAEDNTPNSSETKQRKSIRLEEYDYSLPGNYYVTICTQNRRGLLGKIVDEKMVLNRYGKVVDKIINQLPNRYQNIDLDIYQIMPNHIHTIIIIKKHGNNNVGTPLVGVRTNIVHQWAGTRPAPTIGNIIGAFKSITTNQYIQNVKNNNNWPPFNKRIWQRNYYEHIIRNEEELNRTRKYILDNPQTWPEDKNYFRN